MNLRAVLLVAALGIGAAPVEAGDSDDAGWLAVALASTDADVEAAILAYENADYDDAYARLEAAVARRGERAELFYDRGLVDLGAEDLEAAKAAFQHGTESEHAAVRASSHYELGNLAMIGEDWEAAITAYIECLRTAPDHDSAKWNLELALERKREQDEQDEQDDGEPGEDEQDEGEPGEDEQDEPGEDEQDEQDEQDDGEQDEQEQPEDGQDQPEGEQDQPEDEQDQPEGEQDQNEQDQPEMSPVESADLDAALDELDREDAFMFGRPRGGRGKVEKDW